MLLQEVETRGSEPKLAVCVLVKDVPFFDGWTMQKIRRESIVTVNLDDLTLELPHGVCIHLKRGDFAYRH